MRVLIVDDEPLARQRLRALLEAEADIEVVGECADGRAALAAVRAHKPDLLFLDVCMPEADGFEVLEALADAPPPGVIFVTAYDRFALRAFEVHALDYLLKPFDRERFQKALERGRAQVERARSEDVSRQLQALLADTRTGRKYLDRVVIKSTSRVFFLRVEEIDWIEAAGNYLKLHAGNEAHLLRETMGNLEGRLDPDKFLRIHRSTIVNIERIQELQPWFHGDYVVLLRDGTKLTLSRSYRQKLQDHFGNAL
ncbi:MAG TPA: LytTR family DNA-binding domain-containing protein [Gemmataceae bacterium]|nr:LytTR family DNA-binding domain-containing protein [Gemmataceae bacterium]